MLKIKKVEMSKVVAHMEASIYIYPRDFLCVKSGCLLSRV